MKQSHFFFITLFCCSLFSCQQQQKVSPTQATNHPQARVYSSNCGGISNVTATCNLNNGNPNNQAISFHWDGFQNNSNYRMYIKTLNNETALLKEHLTGFAYTSPSILSLEVTYRVEIVTDCANGNPSIVYAANYRITTAGGGPIIIEIDI